jgi:hypothetical protein
VTRSERTDAGAREVLGQIQALAESMAPGRVRRTKDPKGFTRIEVAGPGKRRLPGGRDDDREHRVTLAYDGAFLQMTYRVGERLHDSRLLSFPATADLAEVEAFLRRALARIRLEPTKAARPAAGARAARRGGRGSGGASGGR